MNKKKRKKRRFKKGAKLLLCIYILIFLLLLGGIYFFYVTNKANVDKSKDDSLVTNEINSDDLKGYRNIAIFGVDSRDNLLETSTHSDTIIIASINRKTKDVKLASIYRDTYVDIPDKGYNKINAAYFKGGYSLALNTINKNFDLDIKEYITVNFSALSRVIDLLGGITLDITKEELKYVNGYTRELNEINGTNIGRLKSAGTQVVNGTHATAYARIRYTAGGDFKRAERQRIVVDKILEKAKSTNLITLNSIINEIFPQIYTNLDFLDIISLSKDLLSYNIVDQTGFPFENSAEYYKKVSYVFPINLAANVTKLHEYLFDTTDYVPSATVQSISDEITSAIGK
jgi:LCP family protein required for cell wall assembly